MKEGAFVKNYFAHCVDVEELYENMVSPVCEKYELTYMEFTVLMFLANNPQYDTATQIVRYRHLAKSHVSVSIRSLQERGLILGEHKGGNHRTIHLSVAGKATDIIAAGRAAQNIHRPLAGQCFIFLNNRRKTAVIEFRTERKRADIR